MTNYVLEIKLESPLTSAAGEGRVGLVDRDIAFDKIGLPILPGRRLKGLWREAYQDVTDAWQQCGQDVAFAEEIFGDSGQRPYDGDALIHIENAVLKDTSALKTWLEYLQHYNIRKLHADDVVQHYATVRAQTAIERKTSAAKENTLRLTRALKSGLVFWANVNFTNTPPETPLLNALALGAASLKYMGIARTRGLGKVKCRLLEIDGNGKIKNDLTSQLNINSLPSIKCTVSSQSVPNSVAQPTSATLTGIENPIHILRYRLTLKSAIVIPTSDGDPNTVVSRQDIPGSHLWGVAAWSYLSEADRSAADSVFRNAFLDGNLRFLSAYPEAMNDQQRMIPMPHSIRKSKEDDTPYDFVTDIPEDEPTKRHHQQYAKLGSATFETQSVKTERNYHHARAANDRRIGRALGAEVPDGGAFFTYNAIQPEQTFQGAVLGSESDLKQLKTWLQSPKSVSIGRSRSAQYGKVLFEWIDDDPQLLNDCVEWNGFNSSQSTANPENTLIITTLSPLLSVNDRGHPIASFPEQEMLKTLGLPDTAKLKLVSSFTRTEAISGYNTHLRLPRQQTQAIEAGSVFKFELDHKPTDEKLLELEQNGLGIRKGEGFGRIAVNRHDYLSSETPLDDPENLNHPNKPGVEVTSDLKQILKQVVLTNCSSEMQEYARDIARQLDNKNKIPSNSLLGRLRLFLRHNEPAESLEQLRNPAKDQLTNFQIDMGQCPSFDLPKLQTLFDIFKKAWTEQVLFTKKSIQNKVNQLENIFEEEIRNEIVETLVNDHSTELCNNFLDYLMTTLRIRRKHLSR